MISFVFVTLRYVHVEDVHVILVHGHVVHTITRLAIGTAIENQCITVAMEICNTKYSCTSATWKFTCITCACAT